MGHRQAFSPAAQDYRTAPSNARRAFWQDIQDSAAYQTGRAERYKTERKFGEAKRRHGFGRCRYLGLLRYGLQAQLTAPVLNLKRIVTLLTGVRFRAGNRSQRPPMGKAPSPAA